MNDKKLLDQSEEELVSVVFKLSGIRASFYKLLRTLVESTVAEEGKRLDEGTFDAFVFSKGLERLAFEFRLSKPEEASSGSGETKATR